MVRDGYWPGFTAACFTLLIANILLPLLTSLAIAIYIGYQVAKEYGARGQSFNILVGLCLTVSIYSLFTTFPGPAVEMVATFGWLLIITKVIISITGKGLTSSVVSPDKQLVMGAIKGKSVVGLLGALVNGPLLLGVAVCALAIIPLVLLDLAINLLFNVGEDIMLFFGIPSLALGTMIWDPVDKAIGVVLGFGSSGSKESTEQVNPSTEKLELAREVYAEIDAELPAATDSEWSSQHIASLTEAELSELTHASFEAEGRDGDSVEIAAIEDNTGSREITLLTNTEIGAEFAALCIKMDHFAKEDEQELMTFIRGKIESARIEPDLVMLSVPIDISLETKLRWLALYNVLVYDNELLRRQFLMHDPGQSPDSVGHGIPSV
jgi:hypothetical protein